MKSYAVTQETSLETKYDFDDITIVPETLSTVNSRKEVLPYITIGDNEFLPLMTSPMDTVIGESNFEIFADNDILLCLPRTIYGNTLQSNWPNAFPSISLDEAEELLKQETRPFMTYFCIDMANGHMIRLFETLRQLNIIRPDIHFIVGNIANPNTYKILGELNNVWGVRVGIGGGGACTTSANVAIHYPMASLISECYTIKETYGLETKIIADGGMRKYSDIIKALALGADIVMIGSLFNKTLQSSSETYLWKLFKVSGKVERWLFDRKFSLYKKFRGMSTKEVQRSWGKEKLTTSEGVVKWNKVMYDLPKWVENFTDYLKSAMSYTSSKTLEEFKSSEKIIISASAYKRFSK